MSLVLILLTVLVAETSATRASCYLRKHNDGRIIGTAKFYSITGRYQNVSVDLYDSGLTDGLHGFHIHEQGVTGCDCLTTGGHYNPDGVNHGGAGGAASSRHVGDFGNVESRQGRIRTKLTYIVNSNKQGRCPVSHPNVYYNGQYCCKSVREKHYKPQGDKCDGSAIQRDSLCCEGDMYLRCPSESGVCESEDRGEGVYNVSEDRFEVRGDRSVVGRAVVLHAGTDDLGLGGDEGSRKTGNAGSRWACCTLQ